MVDPNIYKIDFKLNVITKNKIKIIAYIFGLK
jgi:hypothetical protein